MIWQEGKNALRFATLPINTGTALFCCVRVTRIFIMKNTTLLNACCDVLTFTTVCRMRYAVT